MGLFNRNWAEIGNKFEVRQILSVEDDTDLLSSCLYHVLDMLSSHMLLFHMLSCHELLTHAILSGNLVNNVMSNIINNDDKEKT